MDSQTDVETPRHKRMRKGTKNCTECRRRKVRCIFDSPSATSCVTCVRRRAKCVSQLAGERGEVSPGPLASEAGSHDDGEVSELTASIYSSCKYQWPKSAGMMPTPASEGVGDTVQPTYSNVTAALLLAYPSHRDIQILLQALDEISDLCFQFSYKSCSSSPHEAFKEQLCLSSLLMPETHPVLLARQMLLLASVSRYLPKERNIGLSKHHYLIMEEVAEAAVRQVTTNDKLLVSLEALECVILEAFFNIDSGNIRLAWSTLRRAVTVAQLLGLHRPGHYRFKAIDARFEHDPETMWSSIVSMERILSLLLGLPSSTGAVRLIQGCPTSATHKGPNLHELCGDILLRILERNQIEQSDVALRLTNEIDSDLIEVAERMPAELWRPISFAGIERDSVEAVVEARRAFDRMCYQTMVVQLHLPYMLCPLLATQQNYSQITCVNASREILICAIALRTASSNAVGCFRMNDCLALLAGMTLVLAHAICHCGHSTDRLLSHQRVSDRVTVEQALECLANVSDFSEDVFAVKCASTLRTLLAIEQEAADGKKRMPGPDSSGYELTNRSMTIMSVPHLGAIQISRQGIRAVAFPMADCHADDNDGITIGGIGSIHVSNSPDSTPHPHCPASSVAVMGGTGASQEGALYRSHKDIRPRHTSDNVPQQQDQNSPNATTGLEDWAFQGLDTAFFETLMRGSGDQAFGNSGEADHLEFSTFT